METFLRTWLEWPAVAAFITRYTWAWPLGETFHFFGIILLIGGVGMFDLRLLGVAKRPAGRSGQTAPSMGRHRFHHLRRHGPDVRDRRSRERSDRARTTSSEATRGCS